ncbi:site-specific integrase [Sphingobacterium humi]|uniref:Tyrosine-type recombinase/integrase n=1 Tax=Sphingobacterium humi TaxID=1796905 RepID=A0A6N8L183_9SPHI|nr:site-specific integrase [Sphingobacterium humi]MVZ63495.1 tyrosine-type recombinase/integrase [Sphingobacterium humi]
MVTVRYKPLKSGKFSVYLDIYFRTSDQKSKRSYEFLSIYVHRDYSSSRIRIMEKDSENMKLIRAIRNKRETELNFSKHGYEKPNRPSLELLDYLKECLERRFNYKLECLIIHLGKYIRNKSFLISEVSEEFLSLFQDYLLLYVSQNTTHAYMSVFRQYYNKLLTRRIIDNSPFENWQPVKEVYLERERLTIEEVRTLANVHPDLGNKQIRQAFLFSCFTGLRISDVRRITYDHLIDGFIRFRPFKTPAKIVTVPVVEDVLKIIGEIPKHPINKKIFWGLPSTSQALNQHLKNWAREAGIKKNLHFHVSRHTFATIGLTFGIDLFTMKELLGHSKIEMTQIYAKIVDRKKEEEILKFPSL